MLLSVGRSLTTKKTENVFIFKDMYIFLLKKYLIRPKPIDLNHKKLLYIPFL